MELEEEPFEMDELDEAFPLLAAALIPTPANPPSARAAMMSSATGENRRVANESGCVRRQALWRHASIH
jgi:hypothetical protein